AVAMSDNREPAQPCSENGDAVLLDTSENEVLPADGHNTVTNENKSHEGNQSDANSLNPFPTDLALGNVEELLETQQLEIQSRLSHPEQATAPESALNSCTVVDGLLFPVEYYVRTTRRMSNCQRKVDLDAVILSQLGRSKRGQRSKCKQKDANSDRPSQERVENNLESEVMPFPFLGAESDPTHSGSPQKSLPASSGSSTSLGSISQSSITSTERDQKRLQRKQKGRRKSTCKPPVPPASQELTESLDLVTLRESTMLSHECQSEKENCEANLEKSSSDETNDSLNPGNETFASHTGNLEASVNPDTGGSLFSFRSLQWLALKLGISDFHLPDEEFGLLKLEKLESSPVNDLEAFVPSVFGDGVASEHTQMNPEEKSLGTNLISPFKNGLPKLPHLESSASKKDLSTHELLFTPMGPVLAGAPTQPDSQISSSVFPVVGATPAILPPVHGEVFPNTPSIPPLQASQRSSKGTSAQVMDDGECKASAVPLHLDSCGAGPARKEEEQGTTFPLDAGRGPDNKFDEAVAFEKHQQLESKQQRACRASPEQKKDVAEHLTPVLLDGLREESLQLVSKLKDSSSSCAVDVSSMWWEAAGSRALCVVTACESSVSLWKPLASDCWEKLYTWQLGEIPVIQIVPLPDTCNLVCIALGDLEIGEIRLLLYSENDSFKQSLVKTGNIKAVLGLKDRRLVSSSRTVQEQQVEVVSLSETGRSKDRQTLMPPEETVLAFAEVEGMRDALVGTTAVNSIVVWNVKTGQLLKKMHVGYSYPASICHRAYSDSGLLFVVLSHPHAKESESCGNPAFRVIAFNPKTARSTGVMFTSLPPGQAGRQVPGGLCVPASYLEGDVKDASAAAVLTSGAIAVWDLLLGQCTALLPPDPEGSWALARWATTSACLLAGQRDGTVCLYRY
ncbi:PALB2 protein, partial [Psophia crepitans]|nr:PALB2 protein [Psophia crepitans]